MTIVGSNSTGVQYSKKKKLYCFVEQKNISQIILDKMNAYSFETGESGCYKTLARYIAGCYYKMLEVRVMRLPLRWRMAGLSFAPLTEQLNVFFIPMER